MNSKKQNEKTLVQKPVLKALKSMKFSGLVIDYMRTPSFRAGGVRVGEPGRLDAWALINNGDGTISMLYIEFKYEPNRKIAMTYKNLDYEQRKFVDTLEGKPKTMWCIIWKEGIEAKRQLLGYIEKARRL